MLIKIFRIFYFRILLAFALILMTQSLCSEEKIPTFNVNTSNVIELSDSSYERNLELSTWNTPEQQLYKLERLLISKIQAKPRSSFLHYLLSHLYLRIFMLNPKRVELLRQASELAEQSTLLNPDSEFGIVSRIDLLEITGKKQQSIDLLEQSFAKNRLSTWRYYYLKAKLQQDDKDYNKTLGILEKSLEQKSAIKELVLPLGLRIIAENYSEKELITKLETWNRNFPSPYIDLHLANAFHTKRNFQNAQKYYKKILQKNSPHYLEASLNSAEIFYQKMNRQTIAEKIYRKLLEDQDLDLEIRSFIYANLGVLNLNSKNFIRSNRLFIDALKSSTEQTLTLNFIIDAYVSSGHFSSLNILLNSVLLLMPGIPELHAIHGEVLGERLNKYSQAVSAYENATILDPTNGDYFTSLGLGYYQLKKYTTALASFEKALLLDPNNASALYNKACIFSLLEKSEEALDHLSQAIILDPNLQYEAQMDADFINIWNSKRFKVLTNSAD